MSFLLSSVLFVIIRAAAAAAAELSHVTISNDGNVNSSIASTLIHLSDSDSVLIFESNTNILAPLTDSDSVLISGIRQPISFSYDAVNGNIFILQKKGIVRLCNAWICNTPPSILDFSRNVASYGDHGATSIVYDSSFIYVTYMKLNPIWGYDCADSGALLGRVEADVEGCQVFGRLSRWGVDSDGYVSSNEQVLLDTEENNKACVQFPTHSTPTCVVKGPDGDFFIAMGDGAAYSQLDDGGLGGNVCNDEPPYLGALRAQHPSRFNGKIIRISGTTFEASIESTGHRNPFRLTVVEDRLFATETGWFTAEEINEIKPNNNYGWPCMEGADSTPEYSELPFCKKLLEQTDLFTPPVFSYLHPPVVAQMVASISGIAGLNSFMYFADYSIGTVSRIDMVTFDKESIETMMIGSFVCELQRVGDVILYVDILKGIISRVPSNPIGTPSLSETYPLPVSEIVSLNTDWTPFTGYPAFSAKTNIDGREGTIYIWSVALFYNFRADDCDYTFLFSNDALGGGLTFPSPYLSPTTQGTLEITLEVNTEKGLHAGIASARSQLFLGTANSQLNKCIGMRTQSHLDGAPTGVYFQEGDGVPVITGVAQLNVKANLPRAPPPGTLLLGLENSKTTEATFTLWRTLPVSPWTPFAETDPWAPLNSDNAPEIYSSSDVTATSSLLFAAVPILPAKTALANASYIWRAYLISCSLNMSCGWSFLLEKTTQRPWNFLRSPSVKLPSDGSGVTLLIEAIAITSSNMRTAVQHVLIPSVSSLSDVAAPVCDCIMSLINRYEISISGTSLPAGNYLYEETPAYASYCESITPFTGYDDASFFTATPGPLPKAPVTLTNESINGNGEFTTIDSSPAIDPSNIFTSPAFIGGMAAGAVVVAVLALIVVVIHKTSPSQVPINITAPSSNIRQMSTSQKPTEVEQQASSMRNVAPTSNDSAAMAPRTRPGILSPQGAPSTKAV